MDNQLACSFYIDHGNRLLDSYKMLTGNNLLDDIEVDEKLNLTNIEKLNNAPFVLLSHGLGPDPIFNFGNRAALELFEIEWQYLTKMPSRLSAESMNRVEREHLLSTVARQGFIDNYSGVRISAKGRRFMINQAIVWNMSDADGRYSGQAAMFSKWDFL